MSIFEPSADSRIMAKTLWDIYSSLTNEGFSPDQAMAMILKMLPNNN